MVAALEEGGEGAPCPATLRVTVEETVAGERHEHDVDVSGLAELRSVASRVLAQWALGMLLAGRRGRGQDLQGEEDGACLVVLPDGQAVTIEAGLSAEEVAVRLYAPPSSLSSAKDDEIVEMVDRTGTALGRVPRRLVHRHNLLHRGVGVFVTADRFVDVDPSEEAAAGRCAQPDVYVHRRTSTKRIFPSLYDMFVGGVSLAGESGSATALREVAEELGLDGNPARIIGPILTCVVCTSYNRCVVDLFCYATDRDTESVRWQEEEVSWGSFVPYQVVAAAADRSIQRLAEDGRWPGRIPPVQSRRNSGAPIENDSDWKSWDMVPDGLLVWEAWLRWLDGHSSGIDAAPYS
jgi:8-oxo-dGTP pyrophosphatase MutT (NUDIX family)